MKLIHLSDLHLGKKVNGFSMLEDQKYILLKIRKIIEEEKPDAVIIAGDVYDKTVPGTEAVTLFDRFLSALVKEKTEVFVISGNHDSAERIAFATEILDSTGVHMSPIYNGKVTPIALEDKHGKVNFYMLPFVKPVHVRQALPEEERGTIVRYNDAVKKAIELMEVNPEERNVLITHQFITGSITCDSEEHSVGGTDNVDANAFEAFDYVALGHIHGPQKCTRETIRYCGTPLKYSFSECKDKKSVTVIEMEEKGEVNIRLIELIPKRDWVELKGNFGEFLTKSFYDGKSWSEDYVHITLTDEEDIPDAMGKLRTVYKNVMKLDYDNTRTREYQKVDGAVEADKKSPIELLGELFEQQNNQEMNGEQRELAEKYIESIWR